MPTKKQPSKPRTSANKKAGRGCPEASCSRLVWKRCHGPAIQAGSEKCAASTADSSGGHMVPNAGDAASYNGVRTWRCPRCFEEHRRRIATAKSPDAPLLALRAWEQHPQNTSCQWRRPPKPNLQSWHNQIAGFDPPQPSLLDNDNENRNTD
jgi:hypothetical protein